MKEEICRIKNNYLVLVPHIICNNLHQMFEELDNVLDKGGEGLMLRDPESYYVNKRFNNNYLQINNNESKFHKIFFFL